MKTTQYYWSLTSIFQLCMNDRNDFRLKLIMMWVFLLVFLKVPSNAEVYISRNKSRSGKIKWWKNYEFLCKWCLNTRTCQLSPVTARLENYNQAESLFTCKRKQCLIFDWTIAHETYSHTGLISLLSVSILTLSCTIVLYVASHHSEVKMCGLSRCSSGLNSCSRQ